VSASPTKINLSWTAPSNTGGSVITGYKIEVKKNTGQFETLTPSTQNSTTKYSHVGLATGATYVYRVYAINSVGISSPSSEASAVPSAVLAHSPSAPTLTVTHNTNQANLSWSAPSNDGGAPIIGYKVEYKIGSGSYMTLINKATGTSYSHTGLLANTYSYRVYAVNSAGTSAPSNEISVIVAAPTKPTTPTIPDETETPTEEPEQEVPTTHIPGFPDPAKDPQYYVDRYNNEPEFAAWFDRNFPEESIYDVVGAVDPNEKEIITTHIPGFPDPTKDSDYYIYLYKNEPSFKTWFDENFQDQTIYALFNVQEPEQAPDATKCGTGTHLEGGVCVLDAAKGGGCLIATAAYGTELSTQVQLLREIRDGVLLNTDSGTTFMAGFNQFYYLFSPTVADLERQSPIFKELVKIIISPMLFTLPILNNADSESEMMWYGMGIILLNAGIYLGIPVFSVLTIRNRSKIRNFKSQRQ
jgi:titin